VLAAITRFRRDREKGEFPWCVLTFIFLVYK
jgi:hypothetical protein